MTQPPPYGDQHFGGTPPPGYANSDEKTWALVAHFGGIVGFVPALIVFLVKGQESPTVRAHAVTALNFQILVSAAFVILTMLGFCGGFLLPSALAWLLSLASTAVWIIGVVFAVLGGL